ncbi:MAG: hypothetical protein ACRD6W_11230, partial [Nitrososphaerales archaeon]
MTTDAGEVPSVDAAERAAQFAAGPPRISRRAIWITLGIAAVLGIGGAFADNSFNVPAAPRASNVGHAAHESTSLAQFLGLDVLHLVAAPSFMLASPAGTPFALSQLAGRPVILTFLPAPCLQ